MAKIKQKNTFIDLEISQRNIKSKTFNQRVTGSNPVAPTRGSKGYRRFPKREK
jgi:hypothetical protein